MRPALITRSNGRRNAPCAALLAFRRIGAEGKARADDKFREKRPARAKPARGDLNPWPSAHGIGNPEFAVGNKAVLARR
jgi:hypothetical protein